MAKKPVVWFKRKLFVHVGPGIKPDVCLRFFGMKCNHKHKQERKDNG